MRACSVLALVFLPTLIVGFASRPAHATSCSARAYGIGFGESTSTCGVEVGGQSASVGPIGGYLSQAYAASQPGGIAIVANAQAISNSPYLYPDSSAGATASFRIDDVIFRATEGSPASFIDVSLNFAVSGTLSAWVAPNSAHPQGNGLTSVNLNVVVSLNDYTSTGWQYFSCNRDGCTGSSVGMFASGTIGQFATGTARVPTGTLRCPGFRGRLCAFGSFP